jgi:type III pantothenate kinase
LYHKSNFQAGSDISSLPGSNIGWSKSFIMNIVIDQGNTLCKLAVFKNDRMLERNIFPAPDVAILKTLFEKFPEINRGILSSVSEYSQDIPEFLKGKLKSFIILDAETPIPLKNKYSTKKTLGYDRIADAVGAFTIFPGFNVLVIDAGTAITIDLLTAEGEFYGGNISPGLDLRFRALHEFTKKLPKVEKKKKYPVLGKTTEEAILAGVLNGAVFELEGYINKISSQYSELKIILTGGDIKYFDKKLKNSIFVHSNLNLTGLNRILEYNVEKN